MMTEQNYYELLEVSETANAMDIKKAYARMVRQFPNEKYPEKFQQILKAYKTLTDGDKRRQYDQSLQQGNCEEDIALIETLMEKEQYANALQFISKLLHRFPANDYLCFLEVKCHYFLSRYHEARVGLYSLIERNPNEPVYTEYLAYTYQAENNYDMAVEQFKKLVTQFPEEISYVMNLSECHFHFEKYSKACDVLEQYLSRGKEDINSYPLLYEMYLISAYAGFDSYHESIKNRIIYLPATNDERLELLNRMIESCERLTGEHYLYKEFLFIIKSVNNGRFDDVTQWLNQAMGYINPNQMYYGDNESTAYDEVAATAEVSNSTSSSDSGVGCFTALIFAFIAGFIASFILTPFFGWIVGIYVFFKVI